MLIYNPTFLKIKAILTPHILRVVKKYHTATTHAILKHISELKRESPEEFSLVSFDYGYPWSEQVHSVVVDLVRDCILEEVDDGYQWTGVEDE